MQQIKLLKILQDINNPEKLIKNLPPFTGNFLIDTCSNFIFDGQTWNIALFIKELTETEQAETKETEQPSLLDLLANIPLGKIKIHAATTTWKGLECIGVFIRKADY